MLLVALLAISVGFVAASVRDHHQAAIPRPRGSEAPHTAPLPGFGTISAARIRSSSALPADLLGVISQGTAFRARAGCAQLAHLQLTVDGGYRWASVATPAPHVLSVETVPGSEVDLVGGNTKCRPTSYSSQDGTHWSTGSLSEDWFSSGPKVGTPKGALSDACAAGGGPVVALAAGDSKHAIVICRVGVFRTVDAGKNWTAPGSLPNGHPVSTALTPSGKGVLLMGGLDRCPGVNVLRTTDNGRSWRSSQCLTVSAAKLSVGINANGVGLVVAKPTCYTTTDFGRHWTLIRR